MFSLSLQIFTLQHLLKQFCSPWGCAPKAVCNTSLFEYYTATSHHRPIPSIYKVACGHWIEITDLVCDPNLQQELTRVGTKVIPVAYYSCIYVVIQYLEDTQLYNEMLVIPNALCWSSGKCNQLCLNAPARYYSFLPADVRKGFLRVMRLYSEQQRAFEISNICTPIRAYFICLNFMMRWLITQCFFLFCFVFCLFLFVWSKSSATKCW